MKHERGYFAKHTENAPKIRIPRRTEHNRQEFLRMRAITFRLIRRLKAA